MSKYSEQLSDPRWQKKRLEIMNRDNWTCQICGTTKNSLTVHHFYYTPYKKAWEYDDDVLVTLCNSCHEVAHNEIPKISSLIAFSIVRNRKSFIDVNECLKVGGFL